MAITTGPIATPKTTIEALQQRLESDEARIAALEANRAVAPIRLYQLADAGPCSTVADAMAPVYDQATGLWLPKLVQLI